MNYLNKTITINHLQLKNRLVMPPMATAKSLDGKVNDKILDYYNEKSEGGYIGLIITEHCYVNEQGKAHAGQISIASDDCIDGLSQLTKTIQNNQSKIFVEISHAGSETKSKVTGSPIMAPSAVPNAALKDKNAEMPVEMTKRDMEALIRDFADAARRAKEAGFDGVEIHAAHGYLLNQFYSPLTNHRTDEYNGSTMEGRLRLHKEIIEAVREVVGANYPIAIRFGGCDYMEGGSTIEDSVEASKLYEKWGVDLLDISGGMNGFSIPGHTEAGYFSPMTRAVKSVVRIPVILTGGVTEGKDAEELLKCGNADLIGVGRAILKDSEWAHRVMSEECEDILAK